MIYIYVYIYVHIIDVGACYLYLFFFWVFPSRPGDFLARLPCGHTFHMESGRLTKQDQTGPNQNNIFATFLYTKTQTERLFAFCTFDSTSYYFRYSARPFCGRDTFCCILLRFFSIGFAIKVCKSMAAAAPLTAQISCTDSLCPERWNQMYGSVK